MDIGRKWEGHGALSFRWAANMGPISGKKPQNNVNGEVYYNE